MFDSHIKKINDFVSFMKNTHRTVTTELFLGSDCTALSTKSKDVGF